MKPVVEPGPDDTSVNVRFEVSPGRAAAPAPAEFSGDLGPMSAEELRQHGKLRRQKVFREAVAREDAERYTARYRKIGRSRAEVRYEKVVYDRGTGLATARYGVFAGPAVVLDVTGIREAEVRRNPASPWAKGDPPDGDALDRLRTALLEEMQRKGYARAEVEVEVEAAPDREEVRLHAERGDRWVVGRVSVEGACAVREKTLLSALRTRPRGLLEKGRLVDADVAADRAAIASIYRARGLPDARVESVEAVLGRLPFELDVIFRVVEGAGAWFGRVSVEGKGSPDLDAVAKRFRAKPGGAFVQEDVESDLAALRSALGDGGFPDARVEARTTRRSSEPGAPSVVDVTYAISEGEHAVFGKTILRGMRATHLSVLQRELAYREGSPFSMARLVRTQQNLDRLGVFSRVDVSGLAPVPGSEARSVLVTVEESKPWSLLYGLGLEYDARAERALNPRLSLALTHTNLFGRAIAGVVEARYSRRDSRVLVRVADRSIFDSGLAATITGYVADEIRESYSVQRGGAFFEASRFLGEMLKGSLRYQYELVEPDAPPEILSEIERQDQRIFINSIGASSVVDSRDDPIVPSRGTFAAVEGKWAFPAASADAHFLKGFAQLTIYRPFQGGVLVAGVRAGLTKSLVDCGAENPGCLPNLDTPIVERFFGGGRTTHRSFPLDDLGIEGQTLVDGSGIGGNALLIANVEWRLPVTGGLGIVLFADWGNVWAGPSYLKLADGRLGAGLGLHYLTPVGPFRLEYGFRLDRKASEDAGALSFSIGYPF